MKTKYLVQVTVALLIASGSVFAARDRMPPGSGASLIAMR